MRSAPTIPAFLAPALACAALLAGALVAAPRAATAPPAAAPAGRAVLLTAPADLPPGMLGRKVSAEIAVRVLVSPSGLVDSAKAVAGDERLRAPAEAAARWWVFAPAGESEWTMVTVPVAAGEDAEPLHPDVIALARESEADGDFQTALASWVGALNRLGMNPTVLNEWSIREHAIALARRITPAAPPGDALAGTARGARAQQLRTVARAGHMDLVAQFDHALLRAPWWDEPYLWRAGSLAGCGRTAEAMRSLRAYRLASADSAGVAFAGRMIDRLAAADTVGVCEAIKTWGVVSEPRTR